MACHWRAFSYWLAVSIFLFGAFSHIEAPVFAAKNSVPDAAAARVMLLAEKSTECQTKPRNCSDHSAGRSRKAARRRCLGAAVWLRR